MKKFLFLLPLLALLLFTCDYFNLMSYKEWLERTGNDEIVAYVGGFDGTNACYWKVDEDDKVESNNPDKSSGGAIYSIYVYNNDVYSAGNYWTGSAYNACYWINNEIHYLELEYPSSLSQVNSIIVKNGIVYLAGYENNGSFNVACYWINDKKSNLFSVNSRSNSIFVGNEIDNFYIGGQYTNNNNAYYWINSGKELVDLGINNSINSIYKHNGKIYSIGSYWNGSTDYYVRYWINNNVYQPHDTIIISNFDASKGFVSDNGDIHLVFNNGANSWYSKNGKETQISGSVITNIYVFDENIYLCGNESSNYAAFWREDDITNPVRLSNTGGSFTTSIYVKYKL